jgi:hypothetical protein
MKSALKADLNLNTSRRRFVGRGLGEEEPFQPLSLPVVLRRSGFCLELFPWNRDLRSLKNSPRQLLKVLACLRAFVVFRFHL